MPRVPVASTDYDDAQITPKFEEICSWMVEHMLPIVQRFQSYDPKNLLEHLLTLSFDKVLLKKLCKITPNFEVYSAF